MCVCFFLVILIVITINSIKLVPQAALEKLGLLSVLSAGELKLYDVNNKQSAQLLQLIARTQPACSIPFEDNQYTIPTSEFEKLIVAHKTISPRVLSFAYGEMLRINTALRSLPKPSACRRKLTHRARYLSRYSRKYRPSASSVYYTTETFVRFATSFCIGILH